MESKTAGQGCEQSRGLIVEGLMRITTPIRNAVLLAAALLAPTNALAHAHPLGNITLDWKPDPAIARVAAMNIDFQGGDFFVTWRKPARVEIIEGRRCVVGGYMFFDVADQAAFDIDETVTLELEVDRSQTDGFNVSYDHAVNPAFKRVSLGRAFSTRFEKISVTLERARFANRKYEHTDFAIGALGAMQPQPLGVNGELALCGLRIIRQSAGGTAGAPPSKGGFQLDVRDEHGRATTARVGLYRDDGLSPLPSDQALTLVPFEAQLKQWPLLNPPLKWPSVGRYVFYVDGIYRAEVPSGDYTLVVYKGPEYRLTTEKVRIQAGHTARSRVGLKRWINMPAQNWYSADGHIHLARPTRAANAATLAYTSAEDIHVANLLQVSSVGQRASYPQYAFGRGGDFVDGHHSLVSGQESPRSSHRGHTIGLNVPEYIWSDDGYFLYDRIAKRIGDSGGMFGYAHVAIDAFNVRYGLALDMALGNVDFVEILQMGFMNTAYLYDYLNLGYRLLPSAGSDYPFIRTAGSERIYAKLNGAFSPAAWFEAYRKNRSFVSSGPILEFSVNGETSKTEYAVARGATLQISATVRVNPDIDQIRRLDLVVHGEVVKSVEVMEGAETLTLNHPLPATRSLWWAVRAYGEHGTAAHTAPVYVIVDGDPRTWKTEVVADTAAESIRALRIFKASRPNPDEDWERMDTEPALLNRWDLDKERLDRSIEAAIAKYESLTSAAESR